MSRQHLVFGLHAVSALLREHPQQVTALWVQRGRHDRRMTELVERARSAGILAEPVDRIELDERAAGARHQGVIAECAEMPSATEADLEQLLRDAETPPFLLVLDGVQDPHNLGACLRSADAAGVHAVIAPRDRAVGLNATARKVASGAAEHVPFVQVTNLARTLRRLQELGVWVIGAAGEGDEEVYDVDLTGPLALVLGAEGKGMRRLTRECCDRVVRIPMAGSVSSLNVSVAAGVLLFEAVRQRRRG